MPLQASTASTLAATPPLTTANQQHPEQPSRCYAAPPSSSSSSSTAMSSPAPPPSLRTLRYLVLLERLQSYHRRHTTYRAILLLTLPLFSYLHTPSPTAAHTTIHLLLLSFLLTLTTTRRITTYLVLPLLTTLSFRHLFTLYHYFRPPTPPDWRDTFTVLVLLFCWGSVLYTLLRSPRTHVFAAAGVKGLLVTDWRSEYETRMEAVMSKHERAMSVFCAHMLEWLLVGASTAADTPYIPTHTTSPPNISQWTYPQLLLFRACSPDNPAPMAGFEEMLASSSAAIRGFVENANEIVEMEENFIQRMRQSTAEFSVAGGDAEAEAWCHGVWEREFCGGRGRRLRCLARRLDKVWGRLWRVMGRGEEPEVGDKLPQQVTEALKWFLRIEAGKWGDAVRWEMGREEERLREEARKAEEANKAEQWEEEEEEDDEEEEEEEEVVA